MYMEMFVNDMAIFIFSPQKKGEILSEGHTHKRASGQVRCETPGDVDVQNLVVQCTIGKALL